METTSLGGLEQVMQSPILTYSLVYLLSTVIGLIVLFLIIRAAVQSGTMAALIDAGLVKKGSPWAQRVIAAREAQGRSQSEDSWDESTAQEGGAAADADDPFSDAG